MRSAPAPFANLELTSLLSFLLFLVTKELHYARQRALRDDLLIHNAKIRNVSNSRRFPAFLCIDKTGSSTATDPFLHPSPLFIPSHSPLPFAFAFDFGPVCPLFRLSSDIEPRSLFSPPLSRLGPSATGFCYRLYSCCSKLVNWSPYLRFPSTAPRRSSCWNQESARGKRNLAIS